MGERSLIGWTHNTSNAWHGCEKVSAGCKHCYAETATPVRVKRAGGLELWGGEAARSETKCWRKDLRAWNAAALISGQVVRVFAQSLADTFEDYSGSGVRRADGSIDATLDGLRAEYLAELEACSALTVQLLTKRIENVRKMVPAHWLTTWPAHVQIGCTVEDQENAERRIQHLLAVPAPVRFLSVEPQIGPVLLHGGSVPDPPGSAGVVMGRSGWLRPGGISWVICGGESGAKARSFDLAWARSLRDQCKAAGVPFFLKQLGARPIVDMGTASDHLSQMEQAGLVRLRFADSHGGDEGEWPPDLRGCRAFPGAA